MRRVISRVNTTLARPNLTATRTLFHVSGFQLFFAISNYIFTRFLTGNRLAGKIPAVLCKSKTKPHQSCRLQDNRVVLSKECHVDSWCGVTHRKKNFTLPRLNHNHHLKPSSQPLPPVPHLYLHPRPYPHL